MPEAHLSQALVCLICNILSVGFGMVFFALTVRSLGFYFYLGGALSATSITIGVLFPVGLVFHIVFIIVIWSLYFELKEAEEKEVEFQEQDFV